jgi:mannosyltransferase
VNRPRNRLPPFRLRVAGPLLLICCLAFALRVFRLDAQPIWWDEAISVHLARSSLADIVANRAGNLHPPLYFFLLKAWVAWAGDSAFSVRFPSAWGSVLLVPALYAVGRSWLGRRAGLIAALLAALSPLYLVYAQEARVYAALPLVYLTLLALARRLVRSPSRFGTRSWVALAGIEVLALSLHYMSFFALATVLIALILGVRRRRGDLVRLLAVQAVVALLLLPWLLTVVRHSDAVGARLARGNWQDAPVTVLHFVRLLWTFQLTGQTALVAEPLVVVLTSAVAVALVGALVSQLAVPGARRATVGLLLAWLVPLASAFVVWGVRPLSHPRYVVVFTPPLLLLLAHSLDRLWRRSLPLRGGAALLCVALLATTGVGLVLAHDPRFAKDDTRGVAAAIAARAVEGDLVLVPPEDWSVPYYYDGPAPVEMLQPGDAPADWEQLAGLTGEGTTVFLVSYYRGTHDPRGLLPFALEAAGDLVERWGFKGLHVRAYRLRRSVAPPVLVPADGRFGVLRLTGAWLQPDAAADNAVVAALRWRIEAAVDAPLRVGLRLRDADGWMWAATDDWLLDQRALPTERWDPGQEVNTYHVLPLPPGTPPLTFTLAVGVYEGEGLRAVDLVDEAGNPRGRALELEGVSLQPPLGLGRDPYGQADGVPLWDVPVELEGGPVLMGASLDREVVSPGQPLFVTLHWRADSPLDAPLVGLLELEQAAERLVSAAAPLGGRYPVDRWAAGQAVVEHRHVVVPPAAADGAALLALQVGAQRVELGAVEIAAGERLFTAPPMGTELGIHFGDVAELLGYDLGLTDVGWDETVPITLTWRALEGAAGADYTVFSHILAADGHLVGQHDGPPAGGSRRTRGWVPGEIVVDRHDMTFRELYVGPARIEVGLYDTDTVVRVPLADGALSVLLPDALTVVER